MSKRGKVKNDHQESEHDQPSDTSDTPLPEEMNDKSDPSNRAILAAIANLRNEVTQIKNDLCASVDVHIQVVCTELRKEMASTKKQIQTSIKRLEKAMASHKETVKELAKTTSLHSDSDSLQHQVIRLNSEVSKPSAKCEDLEGRFRRQNIRVIGVPEGVKGSKPLYSESAERDAKSGREATN